MNEFFRLRQLSLNLEEYYSKFFTLPQYTPKMTIEQHVTRFYQVLINEPVNLCLEAMRPTMVQDALLRSKPSYGNKVLTEWEGYLTKTRVLMVLGANQSFADVFSKEQTNLPPPWEVDHGIEIIPRSEPISKRPYKMSLLEAIDLKEQLCQLIEQGFIKPSKSSWGAPILF